MNPFSQRYRSTAFRARMGISYPDNEYSFLSESSRTRIMAYVQHLCKTSKYLEPFLTETNEKRNETYLNEKNVNQASNALLGYSVGNYFNLETIRWNSFTDDTFEQENYNDAVIMDLIELLLVFCKSDSRENISKAFVKLFQNINFPADIVNWMIILRDGNSITTLAPLVKNLTLKSKLEAASGPARNRDKDMEVSARIAADLTQLLYSSEKGKDKTKSYSEEVISKAADMWVAKENREDFTKLVNEITLKVKSLNNQISNIRHTDKHTMIVSGPVIYKMIYSMNMGISELALAATQNELVSVANPEEIKNNYANQFDIDLTAENIISSTTDDGIVNLDDIPF